MSLNKSAAITGFAEMPSSKQPESLTAMDIATRLAAKAVVDAGLDKSDIDGLLTVTPVAEPSILWPTALCETLKLDLAYFDSVDLGGASSAGMVWRAAAAIHSGMCRHVLCVASDVMCSDTFSNIISMVRHYAGAVGQGRRRSAAQRPAHTRCAVRRQSAHGR
jgi:3-oxoacyl-[acyl-carrier-protein] synthase III